MSHIPIQGRIVPKSLIELGVRVLGSQSEFKKWLNEPVFGLGGKKPIDVINGEEGGVKRVENILGAIEYGVYL